MPQMSGEIQSKIKDLEARLSEETQRRKVAENRLNETRETLIAAFKKMPVLIYASDEDGGLVFYNEEYRRVTGFTDQDILDDPEAMNMLVPDSEEEGSSAGAQDGEWRVRSKDGSEKVIAWSNMSKHFPIHGWKSWKVGIDITMQKKLEKDRRIGEKLQGVLKMAGAVCHELNQPLQVVSGYTELIQMDLPEDHPQGELFLKIQKQIDKMARITRKLMTITRYKI